MSAALKLSTEKVKVLDEVTQYGRTIAGSSWTVKVILVVLTSYHIEENRVASPALETSSES